MSFDPFGYEREEERDARQDAGWPDGPDRPDPSEYAPDRLHLSERLDCGHMVEASEDSGGMDEEPRVTEAMVRDLLAFKIKTHDCDRTEEHHRRQRDRVGWGPVEGPPSDVPGMGPVREVY